MLNYSANSSSAGSSYLISNSLRFRASATAYLSRTPASAGNQKTWTWSGWVKRGALGTRGNLFGSVDTYISFIASDILEINLRVSTTNYIWTTTQVFRDPSAWYHIVLAVDTTQATATNRMKLYVNGSQITSFALSATIPQNADTRVNSTALHTIGSYNASTDYLDGYQTEVNFVNAQQLTPSSFGSTNSTTGVWQPKAYTGTYGTNGFYLQFSNIAQTVSSNTGLGKDFSGNTNYWVTNNISTTAGTTYDAMKDSPTLTSSTIANYSIPNPLWLNSTNRVTFSQANLQLIWSAAGTQYQTVFSSFPVSSGKWYWEVTPIAGTSYDWIFGVSGANVAGDPKTTQYTGQRADSIGYYIYTGEKYTNNAASAYGASAGGGDVIGCALDLTAGTMTFYKNGVSQGVAKSGLSGTYYPAFSDGNGVSGCGYYINMGQRPFSYTAPSGHLPLNTYNLPDSTLLKGNTEMDATLYTGTGATLSVTNAAGFKPDLVWIKSRSSAFSNNLTDSNRGTLKALLSDTTGAEGNVNGAVSAFNTNGFSVATGSGGIAEVSNSGSTYVAWQWQAGQGTNTSNTSGTITSTVSVNADAGFSIVTYTGTGANATVGHGLGVALKMIIVKRRNTTEAWPVWHTNLTSGAYRLLLNQTDAQGSVPAVWNSTIPTSSVFSVGTDTSSNASASTYVAYCWAQITGFSNFGSYTGNGSTNGTFVYTGFRPKFLLVKPTNIANDWNIIDTSRDTYNVAEKELFANSSVAESSGTANNYIDILSNGFKLRNTYSGFNGNGNNFIYAAFAENPFKYALAR